MQTGEWKKPGQIIHSKLVERMDTSAKDMSEEFSTLKPAAGCPFLGVMVDAQTRYSCASPANYCHRVQPSEPVSVPHQEEFCLSETFQDCIVYADSWKGKLPAELRGDGPAGSASRVLFAGATLSRLKRNKPKRRPIEEDEPFPVSEYEEEAPPAPVVQEPPARSEDAWLTRLHAEAQTHYQEIPSSRGSGWRWAILLVVALLVIFASLWGVYTRFSQVREQAQSATETARAAALAASVAGTQSVLDATATGEALALLVPSPSPVNTTPTPTIVDLVAVKPTATQESATPDAPPATLSAIACLDGSNYPLEVVSGPNLNPPLGQTYVIGKSDPTVQAAWVVKNTGSCNWKLITLLSPVSREMLTPVIKKDGEVITLKGSDTLVIAPGEQVEILLGFRSSTAREISREWVVVVNGLTLSEQPRLVLEVKNWVMGVEPTATPKVRRTRDTSSTNAPPGSRPTATPPGDRP